MSQHHNGRSNNIFTKCIGLLPGLLCFQNMGCSYNQISASLCSTSAAWEGQTFRQVEPGDGLSTLELQNWDNGCLAVEIIMVGYMNAQFNRALMVSATCSDKGMTG